MNSAGSTPPSSSSRLSLTCWSVDSVTTSLTAPEDMESSRDLSPSPKVPTGPAVLHQTSKKWVSQAEQIRQQRLREQKAARYGRRVTPSLLQPSKEELEQFNKLKAEWEQCFPCSKGILPDSIDQWMQHQRLMTMENERLLARQRLSTQEMEMAGSQNGDGKLLIFEMTKYRAVPWMHGHLRGGALAQQTIWTTEAQTQAQHAPAWPSPKELRYEGEDRHATAGANFHHFLPLPRDWREALRVPGMSPTSQNYKHWEEFPRHHLFHFDYLSWDRAPSHLDIYPFGVGCPVPDCEVCHDYRETFNLHDERDLRKAIDDYLHDVSVEETRHWLNADILISLEN